MAGQNRNNPSEATLANSERLASVETKIESIDTKVDRLQEGQSEIIEAVSEFKQEAVTEDDLEKVKEQTQENAEDIARKKGAASAILVLLSLAAGSWGVFVIFL